MSLKTGILISAALALGAVTQALAQSSDEPAASDSYGNSQSDTSTRPTYRSGRSGTAGKHGGGKDGGMTMGKDGGM